MLIYDNAETQPKFCVGGAAGGKRIALFGDSHAAQWAEALAHEAGREGHQISLPAKGRCPAASVPIFDPWLKRTLHECDEWRRQAIEKLGAIKPDIILVTNYSEAYVDGLGAGAREYWGRELEVTLTKLSATGAQVVYLRDNPNPRFNVLTCLVRAGGTRASPGKCEFSRAMAIDQRLTEVEIRAVKTSANRRMLDVSTMYCASEKWPSLKDGELIYSKRCPGSTFSAGA